MLDRVELRLGLRVNSSRLTGGPGRGERTFYAVVDLLRWSFWVQRWWDYEGAEGGSVWTWGRR